MVDVTEPSARPAYQRVADDLRDRIALGEYRVDDALPSTAELMSLYGVSSTVVRAAIRELKVEGLTRGQAGKAVFVVRQPDPRAEGQDPVMSELRALRDDLAAVNRRLARVEDAVLGDARSRSGSVRTDR
jgi:DNA-binding GntR family transcriptional regulator